MEIIKRIRELAKIQKRSLAYLCEKMGVSRVYFIDREKKGGKIPEDKLRIIAKELNTTVAYLKGETNDMGWGVPTIRSIAKPGKLYIKGVDEIPEDEELDGEPITIYYYPDKNKGEHNVDEDFIRMFDSKHSDTVGVFLGAPKPQSAPVYESLSAAFGKAESGKIIDYRFIDVPGEEEAKRTLFAQINDDSMAPQIKSGALVQILRVDSVDSGAIAAVAVQMLGREEILIRKVIYGHGWVELQSINQKEPSLKFIREGIDNVRILGRVVDIILLNKGV